MRDTLHQPGDLLRTARFWWLNIGTWILVAATNTSAVYADMIKAGREEAWLLILSRHVAFYLPWLFITPAVFYWVQRFPLTGGGWLRQSPKYLVLLGAWVCTYVPSVAVIYAWIFRGSPRQAWQVAQTIPLNAWVSDSVYLLSILGIASAWNQAQVAQRQAKESAQLALENAKLSTRLADAKLHMLRNQLEPHFLFNALNSITALIRTGATEIAAQAVGLLSELLRYAVHAAAHDRLPLSEELDFVEAYLGFQQLRYGDRLETLVEVDATLATKASIPPLVLQPLLENAIRHGVERQEGGSKIALSIEPRGPDLVIQVRNSPGAELSDTAGLGIGLTVTRERLEAIYGQPVELQLRLEPGGFVAELVLPEEAPV